MEPWEYAYHLEQKNRRGQRPESEVEAEVNAYEKKYNEEILPASKRRSEEVIQFERSALERNRMTLAFGLPEASPRIDEYTQGITLILTGLQCVGDSQKVQKRIAEELDIIHQVYPL